ncbi:hypothetical protein [Persephonella sp. IF05-L8]|uniref:hypothetical protein n=1 Tax=Persephonella sp. IF05-L8 TaxID=1158338 RepID=UPI0004962FE6
MGKIIIEIPENIEERIKIEKAEDIDKVLDNLKLRLKRLQFKSKLNDLIGQFDIEETNEDEIYKRGNY